MDCSRKGETVSLFQSLGIEWPVVIAQSVSFLLLLVLLSRYLYKPFQSILAQRREKIADDLAAAAAQEARAEALRKEYEAHLAGIADEARARLELAVKDAEAARTRVLDAAQTEIRELQERNHAQLALEREQLRRELRAEMADIAVLAAGKALRLQLTTPLQAAVIDQVISEMDRVPTNQA